MGRYVLRRLLQMIPTLLAVAALIFLIFSVLPGSFAGTMTGGGRRALSPELVAQINAQFGLDKPLPVRFWDYLVRLLQFDLGTSFRTREPVIDLIAARIWPSLQLALSAMALAVTVGIPLGFVAAMRPGSLLDSITMIFAVSGLSMPQFWLGLLLMYVFALQLGWLPSFGYGGGQLRNLILPAIALGFAPLALLARTTRAGVLEVMASDHIRTAMAKGDSPAQLIRWHVLRNVMVLIVTTLGLQIGSLLGQALVIEKLFSWPGLGSLMVDSVAIRDIPVVQGTILVIVLWFLIINVLVDLVYAAIDPRISLR